MKVPITIGGQKLGAVDVYATTWYEGIPKETQFDLDRAVLEGRVQLEMKIMTREEMAVLNDQARTAAADQRDGGQAGRD